MRWLLFFVVLGLSIWVLVREVEGDTVHVLDPILGVRPMRKQEFLAIWRNVAVGIEESE